MPTSARRRARSRGISTAEVLVGAALSLMLLAVASSFFTGQQRMLLVQSAYAQSQNVTRTFTDLLAREVRMASYDPLGDPGALPKSPTGGSCPNVEQGFTLATPTSMRFRQDLSGDGDTGDQNEDIQYELVGGQIQRTDFNSNGGNALVLVDGVPSGGLIFTYYNNSNPPIQLNAVGSPPALSASDRDCIAKVKVRVTAQLASPQFYDIQPLISSVETQMAVRNRSLYNF